MATTASLQNSVFNTLTHRANTVCSNEELFRHDQWHSRTALIRCNYPKWVFDRLQTKIDFHPSVQINTNTNMCRNKDNKTNNIYMVVPYWKCLVESLRNICMKVGVQIHIRRQHHQESLMVLKDKANIASKGEVINRYKCDHPGCTVEYICETDRTFRDRYKEYLRALTLSMTIPTPQVTPLSWTFSNWGQGVPGCHQDLKGGHVYQDQWPISSTETLARTNYTH